MAEAANTLGACAATLLACQLVYKCLTGLLSCVVLYAVALSCFAVLLFCCLCWRMHELGLSLSSGRYCWRCLEQGWRLTQAMAASDVALVM